jgi:hypothetical protein
MRTRLLKHKLLDDRPADGVVSDAALLRPLRPDVPHCPSLWILHRRHSSRNGQFFLFHFFKAAKKLQTLGVLTRARLRVKGNHFAGWK